jgi:hypothetical protein
MKFRADFLPVPDTRFIARLLGVDARLYSSPLGCVFCGDGKPPKSTRGGGGRRGRPGPLCAVNPCIKRPALGLPGSTRIIPGAFPHSPPTKSTALDDSTQAQARKRCSSLDAPLAIQLRPGLSIGADGAWLVCFFDELLWVVCNARSWRKGV